MSAQVAGSPSATQPSSSPFCEVQTEAPRRATRKEADMPRLLLGSTRRSHRQSRWRIKAVILLVAAAGASVLSVAITSDAKSTRTQPNHALVDKIVVSSDRHAPGTNDLELY